MPAASLTKPRRPRCFCDMKAPPPGSKSARAYPTRGRRGPRSVRLVGRGLGSRGPGISIDRVAQRLVPGGHRRALAAELAQGLEVELGVRSIVLGIEPVVAQQRPL